tara:strand:- start:660 stop:890 length:231 start_codon:yes stop_codon:yes gene_type:complete
MTTPTAKLRKVSQALKNLKINGWTIRGDDPTNETEFLARFHKVVSVDENNNATTSNDPSKFGVTWSQIKTEMDKLG